MDFEEKITTESFRSEEKITNENVIQRKNIGNILKNSSEPFSEQEKNLPKGRNSFFSHSKTFLMHQLVFLLIFWILYIELNKTIFLCFIFCVPQLILSHFFVCSFESLKSRSHGCFSTDAPSNSTSVALPIKLIHTKGVWNITIRKKEIRRSNVDLIT